MNRYIAFLKKEFLEMYKTYKILIIACVFFILGFMNPITAKYTPELLDKFMQEGMSITVAETTALDSWVQFFKNVNLLGILVIILVFSGILSNEFSKGTLVNMLTKGISRSTILISKFFVVTTSWTIFFFFAFGISYGYTKYFWDDNITNILFSVSCVWFFGIFLISLLFLGSVIFKGNYSHILFIGAVVAILYIVNIIPEIAKYNPIMLVTNNMDLLKESKEACDFLYPLGISGLLIVFNIFASIKLFNKRII